MGPHPIPLPCALAFPPPSHRDATTPSPCWALHDPRTHHVLESHPEQAAPLSRHDDERCHAIGSHSALALHLYLAAYNTFSSFWSLSLTPSLLQFVSIVSPYSPSLRLGLPAPQPSRRHQAQSLLGSSFMTQERIMFSNPTPSKPRLSPAATMSDARPSALTPPLHCASILQPTTPPQVVAFES